VELEHQRAGADPRQALGERVPEVVDGALGVERGAAAGQRAGAAQKAPAGSLGERPEGSEEVGDGVVVGGAGQAGGPRAASPVRRLDVPRPARGRAGGGRSGGLEGGGEAFRVEPGQGETPPPQRLVGERRLPPPAREAQAGQVVGRGGDAAVGELPLVETEGGDPVGEIAYGQQPFFQVVMVQVGKVVGTTPCAMP
jgi:hypothetical protein